MTPPWMPLYVADYLADTGHLSPAEHGAYLLLIMHYWQRESLPTDDAALARIARMTPDEWQSAKPNVAAFFTADWRHARIEKERAEAVKKYEKRAAAGRAGGNAKAKGKQCSSNATSEGPSKTEARLYQPQPHSKIDSSDRPEPVSPRDPNDAFAAYSEGELDRLQLEFDSEDVRGSIQELWEWTGRKGAERTNERKALIYQTLKNRRGSSELVAAKAEAPTAQVSASLANSRLAKDPRRRPAIGDAARDAVRRMAGAAASPSPAAGDQRS